MIGGCGWRMCCRGILKTSTTLVLSKHMKGCLRTKQLLKYALQLANRISFRVSTNTLFVPYRIHTWKLGKILVFGENSPKSLKLFISMGKALKTTIHVVSFWFLQYNMYSILATWLKTCPAMPSRLQVRLQDRLRIRSEGLPTCLGWLTCQAARQEQKKTKK